MVHVPILHLEEQLEDKKNDGVLPAPRDDFETALIVMNAETGLLSNCYFRTPEDIECLRELVIQLS